jgi:hypothetical protein
MAMMSPLFNPNNTKPLADSTGGVTTVAPLAEVCRSACKTAGVSRRMQGRMVTQCRGCIDGAADCTGIRMLRAASYRLHRPHLLSGGGAELHKRSVTRPDVSKYACRKELT